MNKTGYLKPTRLASVADVIFSNVDKLSSSGEIQIRLCNYTDVYYNRRIHSRLQFKLATATSREIERFRLLAGDVVITKDSESADDIAVPAYVDDNIPNLVCGYHLAILRPKKDILDGRFLTQLLQQQHTRQYFATLANGVTRFGLGTDAINEARIRLPNIAVQRKIADILTTWDEALEKLDALIAAKERRKKVLMQKLLTSRMRFPALANSPWKEVRMGELLSRVYRPIDWTADMKLSLVSLRRRCGGLFRRPVVLGADYKTQDLHELKVNDFLVSKRQVSHGAWAMVPSGFEGSHVSKEYAIFVNTSPDRLYMPYFAWLAQTPCMIHLARVASTGVHIEKLIFDPKEFLRKSIRIPVAITEQKQIAAILDSIQLELHLLRAHRHARAQQKRGLMQQLLTGKVRVNISQGGQYA
ncbi:MAG: restriction endonuclease subunit S [Planctomycetota bacterium]